MFSLIPSWFPAYKRFQSLYGWSDAMLKTMPSINQGTPNPKRRPKPRKLADYTPIYILLRLLGSHLTRVPNWTSETSEFCFVLVTIFQELDVDVLPAASLEFIYSSFLKSFAIHYNYISRYFPVKNLAPGFDLLFLLEAFSVQRSYIFSTLFDGWNISDTSIPPLFICWVLVGKGGQLHQVWYL